MTPEERFTKMENLLHAMMEHQAGQQQLLQSQSEEITRQNAGIRDLIVVSRTILTTAEKLVASQDKVTEQIKELREAQAGTDERLNILVDEVNRIIRALGKNGTR
jgi:hypothetical protein